MPGIHCTKCGATGSSKCPYCRSIFDDNHAEGMISNILHFDVVTKENGNNWLNISVYMSDDMNFDPKMAVVRTVEKLREWLNCMAEEKQFSSASSKWPSLKRYFCHHDWRINDGEVSSIGCSHKGNPLPVS